jgi:SAM-dependent methyltransferase
MLPRHYPELAHRLRYAGQRRQPGGSPIDVRTATATRRKFSPSDDGLIYVGTTALTYSDGSEGRVLEILRESSDLSSTSAEMCDRAENWAERYHTHPSRGNVIRAFDIPPGSSILEIGAGCGGVTRYLGEVGATVDALEPMPSRALAARERTRDLPGVEVLVGELADLPEEPAYDVVVVVGVLEYVGLGTDDSAPYVSFLSGIRKRLNPGGSLVLAIENQFGVKYLVGAPEDHTSQVFDSIEGYPRGERARTFSKSALLGMAAEAGLTGSTLAAFPDYKLTETVFDPDRFPRDARPMLSTISTFPSPDWTLARPSLASERLVWGELVKAGLSSETPNSFVMVATAAPGPESILWPAGRAARSWPIDVRPDFAMQTTATTSADGSSVFSHSVFLTTASTNVGDIHRVKVDEQFTAGTPLAERIARATIKQRIDLLSSWRLLLAANATEDGFPVDDSAIVLESGELLARASGIRIRSIDLHQSIARGVLQLGIAAAERSTPEAWPGASTVRDIVNHLASLVQIDAPDWLESTLATEADIRSVVSARYRSAVSPSSWRAEFEETLDRRLDSLELGIRSFNGRAALDSELTALQNSFAGSQDLLAEAQREVERLRALQLGNPIRRRLRRWLRR